MQLLVYYQDKKDFSSLKKIINNLSLDIALDETNKLKKAEIFLAQHEYDTIFIDFKAQQSEYLIQTILKHQPSQRIIILNDTFGCFDNKNCKQCQERYNVATVIKPINLFQMAALLKNEFHCESCMKSKKEFTFEQIIKNIIEKYPFLQFDRSKYYFDLRLIDNPLKSSILIELVRTLKNSSIEHYLLDDFLHIVEFKT